MWYRLRRALARAKAAYAISDEDAQQLVADGYVRAACGTEIAPEKIIVFVDDQRLEHLGTRRQIPLGLGPEFLSATATALVPFDDLS